MSITSTATTLDTSWTEQSVAMFTPGVLGTPTDMVNEVGKMLKRGGASGVDTLDGTTTPSSTDVTNWIHRGKEELAEIKNFTFDRRYAYATLAAGDYRISLPNDYNGGHVRLKDTTNNRYIPIWDNDAFDMKYPDPAEENQSEILTATIKNRELIVLPPPNGADVLEIEYKRDGSDATGVDWLPEMERWRVVDFAVAMGFYSLHMWDEGDRYMALWNAGIGKAIRADAKRKWLQRRSCINVFQEYTLLHNQPTRYTT